MKAGTRPIIDRNVSIEAPRPETKGPSMASHVQKMSAALFASVLIGSGLFILLVSTAPSAGWDHLEPVSIDGDTELGTHSAVREGAGTESDPYLIYGWEISSFAWDGIKILHTTAYFVISDVHVNSTGAAGDMMNSAVWLEDVSNARIESSLFNSTAVGIYLTGCDNIVIYDVEVRNCTGWAVECYQSQDVAVADSSLSGYNGLYGQDDSCLGVLGCDIEDTGYGVSLRTSTTRPCRAIQFWAANTG